MNKTFFPLIVVLTVFCCFFLPGQAAASEELNAAMSRFLTRLPMHAVVSVKQEIPISKVDLFLAAIYAANDMKPLWVSEKGPDKNAAVILQFLENAETEGLRSSDYDVQGINRLWRSRQLDDLAQLDTLLTLNLAKYIHDVSHGRLSPFESEPELFAEAGDRHFKPVLIIENARAAENLAAYLADLPPHHEYYRKLRETLKEYRKIAATGGWERIPAGKSLHPGDRDERVEKVRERFGAAAAFENETLYDDQLVLHIKQFQKKFGLKVDGVIGPNTLEALNRSPEDIIEVIILNMARWRWQKIEFGRRYIMVNIANYDLVAVEDDRIILEMAVIVGKLQHQTPVFSRRVQYVDINPFWNITPSIAAKEELPELQKDRFYLAKRKVRVFSNWQDDGVELDSTEIDWHKVTAGKMKQYKLRQDPGLFNALGQIKFVFPNEYDVYIHGTPAQELFEHNKRNFSHGCIRASRPLELAEFLLSGEKQGWSLARIKEIVGQGQRMVVNITNPVSVHITYQTVWIDNLGEIHFNDDIYGRDRKLAAILLAQENERNKENQQILEQ